jgi:flavorubredoxin
MIADGDPATLAWAGRASYAPIGPERNSNDLVETRRQVSFGSLRPTGADRPPPGAFVAQGDHRMSTGHSSTRVDEVAPDIFRICTFVPDFQLQFNQFLLRDEEPVLVHTGMRALFPAVEQAVASLIDVGELRWLTFSHFEADECGALNEWLERAPRSSAACSTVGAMVSVDDFAQRPARQLADGEALETGSHRLRFLSTPHVPHGWDAGLLFDELTGSLFCSDLLHQLGDVEPRSETGDLVGRFETAIREYDSGPLAGYLPWTPRTAAILESLAALEPKHALPMHGSAYCGDGGRLLRDVATMMQRTLGG